MALYVLQTKVQVMLAARAPKAVVGKAGMSVIASPVRNLNHHLVKFLIAASAASAN